MSDEVDQPAHYTIGIPTIDYIESKPNLNYHLGNVIKYVSRAGLKTPNPIKDLKKARWYLDREITRLSAGSGDRSEEKPKGGSEF